MTYSKEVLAPYGIVQTGPEFGTFGERRCLFEIPLATGRTVWMDQRLTKQSDYWIVLVEKRPFLQAWARAHQERHLAVGDESIWRQDRKFADAEDGFSHGRENPVPLAECGGGYLVEDGLPVLWLSIGNGVTRTIWLLANGVERFPVKVSTARTAQLIHRGAGVKSTCPLSIKGLYEVIYP
ncbi:plasmid fertility inhibition factor family protein [Serratia fonticola]